MYRGGRNDLPYRHYGKEYGDPIGGWGEGPTKGSGWGHDYSGWVLGEVLINPSQEQLEEYQGRSKRFSKKQEELVRLKEEPAKTLDGHRVKLHGNIGMPEEVEKVLEYGGEGVGLVRTESLYTLRELPPTEEEQYLAYRRILEGMKGAPVVIRTMDMGGDKESSCFQLPKEENPFLGRRGIRLSLNDPSTLKTQLRVFSGRACMGMP